MEGQTQTAPPLSRMMISKAAIAKIAQTAIVLLVAFSLKYHYSTASVNDLRWILAPTAFLVELLSGVKFTFESHAGFMSADNTFLIAAPCSGVNFLIIAFVMLALGELWRERSRKTGWNFLPISMLVAYATTIIANTVRIDIALRTRATDIGSSWLGPEELHRVEGIFVYFGFLLLLFILAEMIRGKAHTKDVIHHLPLPLLIYYITTLGIPVLTGAYREPSFVKHSVFVLLTPLTLMLPVTVFVLIKRMLTLDRKP